MPARPCGRSRTTQGWRMMAGREMRCCAVGRSSRCSRSWHSDDSCKWAKLPVKWTLMIHTQVLQQETVRKGGRPFDCCARNYIVRN